MLVFALDSSATAVSAAVMEDGRLLGEFYGNTKQTHSQTLLPMAQALLLSVQKQWNDFDLLAASVGPGSFTGIRIGVATVKGLAFPRNIPCCGISTLEAIAYGGLALEGKYLCAVMDARCSQVYHALFQILDGVPVRLCEDRAVSIPVLLEECRPYGDQMILLGDGAALCHQTFAAAGVRLAPEPMRFQHASGVALAAHRRAGEYCSPEELAPTYLRLPQAERELKKRTACEKTKETKPNETGNRL